MDMEVRRRMQGEKPMSAVGHREAGEEKGDIRIKGKGHAPWGGDKIRREGVQNIDVANQGRGGVCEKPARCGRGGNISKTYT